MKNDNRKLSQKLKDHTSALTRMGTVYQFWKKGQNPEFSLDFSQRELERADLIWTLGETRGVQRQAAHQSLYLE